MADNVNVTPGTGATVAADDVGGVLFQRVKVTHGVDGVATDASATNPLPVLSKIDQTTRGTTNAVTLVDVNGNPVQDPTLNYALAAYTAAVSNTRPADTTAYTAGDVVGPTAAAWLFPSIGPSGGRALITSASLEVDIAAVPSGMTSFRLYLYSVTPPSALADNAAWDLVSGDRASFLGYIDLGTPADLGSTLYCEVNGINKQVKIASADLFGYLVTNGAYTPNSASVYKITLHSVLVG